jgi:hypothetical protein
LVIFINEIESIEHIDYKNEIINNLELLNENKIKYVYHIIEAKKAKKIYKFQKRVICESFDWYNNYEKS